MRRSDIFPSKYLTCDDIPDEGITFTIATVEEEKMRDGKPKPVIFFRDAEPDKPLVCNVTNWSAIEKLYGEESDEWEGKQITLYPSVTSFEGEEVGCIRVRTKPKKEKPAKNGKAVAKGSPEAEAAIKAASVPVPGEDDEKTKPPF